MKAFLIILLTLLSVLLGPTTEAQAQKQGPPRGQIPLPETGEKPSPRQERTEADEAFEILEEPFEDDLKLHEWLKKKQRKYSGALLRIFPITEKKSLFVFQKVKAGPGSQYWVLPMRIALSRESLETRMKAYQGLLLVGLHRLDDISYLVVFYGKQ